MGGMREVLCNGWYVVRVLCDGCYMVRVLCDVWYVVKFYVMGLLCREFNVKGGMW